MQTQTRQQETLIPLLSEGFIAIPKDFWKILGFKKGKVAKAKIVNNTLVIQSQKANIDKDYRVFTKEQVDQWVKEDQLPEPLATKVGKYWSDIS